MKYWMYLISVLAFVALLGIAEYWQAERGEVVRMTAVINAYNQRLRLHEGEASDYVGEGHQGGRVSASAYAGDGIGIVSRAPAMSGQKPEYSVHQFTVLGQFAKIRRDLIHSPQTQALLDEALLRCEKELAALDEVFRGADVPLKAAEQKFQVSLQQIEGVVRQSCGDELARKVSSNLMAREVESAVEKVAQYSGFGDRALTAEQAQQLRDVLVMTAGIDVNSRSRIRLSQVDWTSAMKRCSTFLAPHQLDILQSIEAKSSFDSMFEASAGIPSKSGLPKW